MDNGFNNNDGPLNMNNSNNNVQISQSTNTLLNLGSLDGYNITPPIQISNSSNSLVNTQYFNNNNNSMNVDMKNSNKLKIKNEDGSYPDQFSNQFVNNNNNNNINAFSQNDTFQQLQHNLNSIPQYTTNNNNNNINNNNNNNNNNSNNNNNNINNMYMQQSNQTQQQQYLIPSISITPTHDNHSHLLNNRTGLTSSGNNNYSPRPSPNGSPHHSPIGSPHHSPLLNNENFLSLNSENDSSDPLSSSFIEAPPFAWNNYKSEEWYTTFNANGEVMQTPILNIFATKGFTFINGSWVYCRRNHFQLDITAVYPKNSQEFISNLSSSSSNIDPSQTPSYLLINGNKTPINGLTLTIKGIKNRTDMTQPENEVELFQTNSKREKQGEHAPKPVAIQFGTLISVQRLHFRKATLNNARRNGQPNPHQEYNQLVVSLYGRCGGQEYCIVSYVSPPLIVRTAISSPSVSPVATDLSPVHTPDQSTTTTNTNTTSHHHHHHNSSNNNNNTTTVSPINTFGSNLNSFPDFSTMRLQSPSHTPNSPRNQHNPNNNTNNSLQQQQMIGSLVPNIMKTGSGGSHNFCEWTHGDTEKSIIYNGKVGINCDNPTFTLSVQGTIYASENVFHPSDMRLKYNQRPVDSQVSLRNVNKLKIYDYKLNPQWSMMCGRDPYQDTTERGVMAQDLQQILPNAVRTIGNHNINGQELENLLVINSEALVFENIGATQCLSTKLDSLNEKIIEQEKTIQSLKSSFKISNILSIVVLFILLVLMISLFFLISNNHHYKSNNNHHHRH